MRDAKSFQLGMRQDAGGAAMGAGAIGLRIAKTVAAESGPVRYSGHNHAAPRTPLESPCRFFMIFGCAP
jgi:hypothetical protein